MAAVVRGVVEILRVVEVVGAAVVVDADVAVRLGVVIFGRVKMTGLLIVILLSLNFQIQVYFLKFYENSFD